jgi:diguanylate cyclase
VGMLAVTRKRTASFALALDGLVATLAVAAVSLAVLWPTLIGLATDGTSSPAAVAVNLAYPALDVVLLVIIVGVLAVGSRPRSAALWSLAAGIVGLAVVDVTFLQLAVTGGLGTGSWTSPLSALSLGASALLALAAWAPDRGPDPRRADDSPGLLAPTAASLVCLAVLVAASFGPLPRIAVGLATAGVVAAIARTAVTFRLVRAAAEHHRAARTDELTDLANRRACNERLEATVAARGQHGRVVVLILDLDRFRDVNDSYGHHEGDALLRAVARRLTAVIGTGDLLARIGGDEFAVILADRGPGEAVVLAERLQASLRRPFPVGPGELGIDASVGMASYPDDASDAAELLRLADLAMYEAKLSGSGPRRYDPRRHRSAADRRRSVEELRRALDRDELVVHYQPQVSLTTGEVVGVEALVRWQHPDAGLLGPAGFLPVAEANGLMRLLTAYVLQRAARATAAWRAEGVELTVSVNLSVSNLLDLEFPAQLDLVLASFGLPGRALSLELTEDQFVADPARAQRVITSLLERDVRLFVDDYGTGYSSLGYLRDLSGLAGLKLDRSFVARIDTDLRARAIVGSTIALADSLGLEVIAEGVETPVVRDLLRELGCPIAQGFLFARPLPPEDLDLRPLPLGRRAQA